MKKVTLVRGVACIQSEKQNLFLSLIYKSYHVRTSSTAMKHHVLSSVFKILFHLQ